MEQQSRNAESGEFLPEARRLFWLDFVRHEHRREMELLLNEAKLGGRPHKVDGKWEGWNNVIKHQVGEAAAMRALCHALGIDPAQAAKLETFAFIHDARKHLEKAKYQDFTAEERHVFKKKRRKIEKEVDPEGSLRTSTTEEFFYKLFERTPGATLDEKIANTPREELLQYYIDSIFLDGTIVSPMERIQKTEQRRKDLNDDPRRSRRLGMHYWSAERKVALKVQSLIFQWLREKGVPAQELRDAETVPSFIHRKMNQEMVEHWLDAHGRSHAEMIRDVAEAESPYVLDVLSDARRENPADNEDQGVVREEKGVVMAGVFDGATTIADIPYFRQLGKKPGNVASTICKAVLKTLPMETPPKDALLAMNRTLCSVLAAMPLSPQEKAELLTMGLVVRQQGKRVQFANVGDTSLVKVGKNGSVTFLTGDRVEPFEMQEYQAALEDARAAGVPVVEILKQGGSRCWEVINLNRTRENAPDGSTYGVLKGGDDAVIGQYIQSGEVELEEGESLLLYTDGLLLPVSVPLSKRKEFMEEHLRNGGMRALLEATRKVEEGDPSCERYLRLKMHDDGTGVEIRRKEESAG